MTRRDRGRLSFDVEPNLRSRIKVAAARKGLSVREYVEGVLRQALEEDELQIEQGNVRSWSTISARSFGRDWDSDEDAAYDRLAESA